MNIVVNKSMRVSGLIMGINPNINRWNAVPKRDTEQHRGENPERQISIQKRKAFLARNRRCRRFSRLNIEQFSFSLEKIETGFLD